MDELASVGALFIGMGAMVFMFVLAWIMYQFGRGLQSSANVEDRMCTFESATLNKIAKSKGINLELELEKQRLVSRKHNFRRGIKRAMYEDMFGKEETEKESK